MKAAYCGVNAKGFYLLLISIPLRAVSLHVSKLYTTSVFFFETPDIVNIEFVHTIAHKVFFYTFQFTKIA